MAEYQGRKVKLNKPTRIAKGQAGYGRKKFKVFVKDGSKVKKVMFGDPNMRIKKSSPAGKAMGGRIYKAGGGVSEAAEKLRRQGLKGGGICKKGMNRKAVGKNS